MKRFNKIKRYISAVIVIVLALVCANPVETKAEVFYMNGGRQFDSVFYAAYYPDLGAKYGNDTKSLLNHYLNYGIYEGRLPSLMYLTNNDAIAYRGIVPMEKLANRNTVFRNCGGYKSAEAIGAYYGACDFIIKGGYINMSRRNQLATITKDMGNLINAMVPYTITPYHHDDPCGIFGCVYIDNTQATKHPNLMPYYDPTNEDYKNHRLGVSSAGATRSMGLVFNMLAIPYEHVNENTWKHQWCRVNYNGTYYVCDPYLGYFVKEPAPYKHPAIP